jgi:hypothetical protein
MVWEDFDGACCHDHAFTSLASAISSCSVFIVLVTQVSVNRAWVRWEVSRALEVSEVSIIPIYRDVHPAEFPVPFSGLTHHAPLHFQARSETLRRAREA